MLEIISVCLSIISICLTIYELFWKRTSDNISYYIQTIIVQQINPKYDVEIPIYPVREKMDFPAGECPDSIKIENARWKLKRITQIVAILIYVSMIINFVSYINTNAISSMTDIMAIVYIPLSNTMRQLSVILIVICILLVVRGWNKRQTTLSNIISMKYFSLKIITDFFTIIGFSLVNYEYLEKVNENIQNPIFMFSMIGWAILFICQVLWIQFTISKLYKLVSVPITYEAKEKQLLSALPVYIVSFLLFGLTVYIKIF